jgi:hypothetical protein
MWIPFPVYGERMRKAPSSAPDPEYKQRTPKTQWFSDPARVKVFRNPKPGKRYIQVTGCGSGVPIPEHHHSRFHFAREGYHAPFRHSGRRKNDPDIYRVPRPRTLPGHRRIPVSVHAFPDSGFPRGGGSGTRTPGIYNVRFVMMG